MNRDTEDFPERFLVWLLQNNNAPQLSRQWSKTDATASGEVPQSLSSGEIDEIHTWEIDEFDELESEILNATVASPGESAVYPQSKSGKENFALQDRFQALVKRRLQKELQDHPPLFPWETEISDCESDAELAPSSPNQFWTTHLQRLRLPVPIPPDIFAQLVDCCQTVVHSSIASPIKLVRAVERLFPGQSQMLHQFASVVVSSAACDNLHQIDLSGVETDFPSSYEAATPTEQMVLLLIAARQIIGSLTLTLSPHQPIVESEWLTAVGDLVLRAEYQVERHLLACLRVQGRFPCGGSLKLSVGQSCAIASRSDAGQLSVELSDLELNQTYPLEVLCPHLHENPLIFGICPTS